MFDTMKVAKKIREARIARNMTQMNLADAMEVSYQAVSNWERGNSMPDISKLEQLCQVLELSMEELLGAEGSSRTLTRFIDRAENSKSEKEPVTIEEIQSLAPILPPADVEHLVEDNLEREEKIDLSAISGLAPFLDEEYLDSLVQRAHVKSLRELTGLAPFLSEATLDRLVAGFDLETDAAEIISLAPFLSEKALDQLASQIQSVGNLNDLVELAPFLSEETLDKLVMKADPSRHMSDIVSLAPFLSEETLDKLVENISESDCKNISGLYPFLSQESLRKIAEVLMHGGDLQGLKSITPFL